MSKFPLDLSKFKKVRSDDKTSVLQHVDGHQLTIAHGKLAKGLRDQLDRIKMADGGGPILPNGGMSQDEAIAQNPGPEATTGFNPNNNGLDIEPIEQNSSNAPLEIEPVNPNSPESAAAPAPQPQPESPAQPEPQAHPAAPAQPTPQDIKQYHTDEALHEDAKMDNDLKAGHITPKTYQDMFGKGVFGQMGTIFGLMMSGGGSAMAGQQNALLGMMNNVISNDLEAQKQNISNKQNLYKLLDQHDLNQAQVGQISLNNQITKDARARMIANRLFLEELRKQADKYAPGTPERQKADEQLAMLHGQVNMENFKAADVIGTQRAMMSYMNGGAPGGNDNSDVGIAKNLRTKKAMGFIDDGQYKDGLKEMSMVQNKKQINQNALDSFDNVAKMQTVGYHAGNPVQSSKRIDAEWNPMMDKLTKDTEGRVTPITVDMMGAVKPALTDNAQTTQLKRQKFQSILNSGFATPTLDSLGMSPQKGSQAGSEIKTFNGSQYQKVNGGWQKVK